MAISGDISGTSKEKLNGKLGLETLEKRRWYRKLCCFLKILTSVSTYNTKNTNNIPLFKVNHKFIRNSPFPAAVIEWNKQDLNIRNSERLNIFKKTLLNFIRTSVSTTLNSHNPKGFKLLIRLSLASSHLREHKFEHSFQDSLNAICSCGNDIEMSAHYLLQCPNFSNERPLFLNIIGSIDKNILKRNDLQVTETLLTTIVIQTI